MTLAATQVDPAVRAQLEQQAGRPLSDEEIQQLLNELTTPQISASTSSAATATAPAAQEESGGLMSKVGGLFKRDDGLGFRLLQSLGNVGSGISRSRAISNANKANAESGAHANLVNALARRRVASGTRTQPTLGLMGQLSGAVGEVGQAGLDIQQLGRKEEQRGIDNAQAERRTRATELSAQSSLLRSLGKSPTVKTLTKEQRDSIVRLIKGGTDLDLSVFTKADQLAIRGLVDHPEPQEFEFTEGNEKELHSIGYRNSKADAKELMPDWVPEAHRQSAIGMIVAGQDDFEVEDEDELDPDPAAAQSAFLLDELEKTWDEASFTGLGKSAADAVGLDFDEGGFTRRLAPASADLNDQLETMGLALAKELQGARASDLDLKTAKKALPRQTDSDELAKRKFKRLREAARVKREEMEQGIDQPLIIGTRAGVAVLRTDKDLTVDDTRESETEDTGSTNFDAVKVE